MKCWHTEGLLHNCILVDRVNALVPLAEKIATERVAKVFGFDNDVQLEVALEDPEENGHDKETLALCRDAWTRVYHETMNRLCEDAGIRRLVPKEWR